MTRSSSPMSICAFCRECSSRSSSCDAADRLVRNRDQRTDALIVACDHRGLRTAVVKQDFPSRAVSQVLPARSAATALAVSFNGPLPPKACNAPCPQVVEPDMTAETGSADLFARNPAVSAFPENPIGSACASSFSRLARRSLTLQPAHSRCHQFVTRIPKASAISSPP